VKSELSTRKTLPLPYNTFSGFLLQSRKFACTNCVQIHLHASHVKPLVHDNCDNNKMPSLITTILKMRSM
jgi:hypothetical protein